MEFTDYPSTMHQLHHVLLIVKAACGAWTSRVKVLPAILRRAQKPLHVAQVAVRLQSRRAHVIAVWWMPTPATRKCIEGGQMNLKSGL